MSSPEVYAKPLFEPYMVTAILVGDHWRPIEAGTYKEFVVGHSITTYVRYQTQDEYIRGGDFTIVEDNRITGWKIDPALAPPITTQETTPNV